jgi:hypothetical protein
MISEFVEYVKQAWKNKPNVSSPLNADRMNHMEAGIENNSKKIKETVTAVNELTENMDHGKIVVRNGVAKITFNHKFKKIPSVVASLIGKGTDIMMCIKISDVSLTEANVTIVRIKDDGSSGKLDFDHEIYWIALG